tara:strand:- start:1948 stop:2853 length:906 start_codon:yes stop_codon:yes gene_type:complete
MRVALIALIISLVLLTACVPVGEPFAFVESKNQAPSMAAWQGNLYMSTSDDGVTFNEKELFVEHAGVPNLLLTSEGLLIATFQYFDPYDEDIFDVIAYKISEDNGESWSNTKILEFEGLPELSSVWRKVNAAVDPTLIELEDGSLRLYFTYQSDEDEYARMASAKAEDIFSPFVYEEGVRLALEGRHLLDPVIVYFEGMWHHYSWTKFEQLPELYTNIHSVSKDGLHFERQEDIIIGVNFIGQAIEEDGELLFYGQDKEIIIASSEDGYNWKEGESTKTSGGDPGIVKLNDGSYIMLYTRY